MKITVIVRDLSDAFWSGNGDLIPSFLAQSAIDRLDRLTRLSVDLPRNISIKVGNGSFRDKVDWNQAMRDATRKERMTAKIEPRRGYRLVTFEL
jgi:hypothetical protein